MENKDNKIPVLDINALKKCHAFLVEKLNKSCKEGVFDLQDACDSKIALDVFASCVNNIGRYQALHAKMSNKDLDLDLDLDIDNITA